MSVEKARWFIGAHRQIQGQGVKKYHILKFAHLFIYQTHQFRRDVDCLNKRNFAVYYKGSYTLAEVQNVKKKSVKDFFFIS